MPTRPPLHRPNAPTKAERDKRHDARRSAEQPWRHWYWSARWRRIAKKQLTEHPLCATCDKEGRIVPATVCDHIIPHRGDADLFWNGERQSLCATCHSRDKQAEERGGRARQAVGADGWPV
ncbi:HNH endonuclease [Methylobacillus flagellatus]|nr:HNH endonuclease [Methylobacillus flagellatus]